MAASCLTCRTRGAAGLRLLPDIYREGRQWQLPQLDQNSGEELEQLVLSHHRPGLHKIMQIADQHYLVPYCPYVVTNFLP